MTVTTRITGPNTSTYRSGKTAPKRLITATQLIQLAVAESGRRSGRAGSPIDRAAVGAERSGEGGVWVIV